MGGYTEQHNSEDVPFWTSQRLLVSVIVFIGLACHSMQRVNLSIAMVCMVRPETRLGTWNDNTSSVNGSDIISGRSHVFLNGHATVLNNGMEEHVNSTEQNVSKSYTVPLSRTEAGSSPISVVDRCGAVTSAEGDSETGEFTWPKETQGLLLGACFWGYLFLQVFGGILSERYGARVVVMVSMFPVSILDLLSPLCARTSPWLFMASRVLMGVGQGTMYPSVQALLSRWVPTSERGRLVSVSFAGCDIGSVFMLPLGGILCSAVGWPSVFYFTGLSGVVWCFLWWGLVRDTPSKCSRISKAERDYLAENVHVLDRRKSGKPFRLPWGSVFTSLPFISILLAHGANAYGYFVMATQLPTYMKEILKFDLKSNGFFSMLPYITISLMSFVCGSIADQLIQRKILSCQCTRKLMAGIGLFVPAVCLVLLTFVDCTQQMLAVAVLCITFAFTAFQLSGILVNHGDIAPQFAGTLFGITNTLAAVTGIVAPYVVAVVTVNKTPEEWQMAFIIAAVIYVCGGIQFLIFAKGNIQTWAMSSELQIEMNVPDPKDPELDNALLNDKIPEKDTECDKILEKDAEYKRVLGLD